MNRTLVAIPAYNEEHTIARVVEDVRRRAPDFDLLVVNDGSRDETSRVLGELGVVTAPHLCNLGYGRALQTAIKYATAEHYDLLITFDADGQHDAGDIERLYRRFDKGDLDLMIGSRFVATQSYLGAPLGRRIGMRFCSLLVRLFTGRRIYDTTSGLKVIHRRVFAPLTARPSIDFHAEVIVYLLRSGYRLGEHPITVAERQHGESMYSWISAIKYPLKISLLIVLNVIEVALSRNGRR